MWKALITYSAALYADGAVRGFDRETAHPQLDVGVRGKCVTLRCPAGEHLVHLVNKRTGRDIQLDRITKIQITKES
jgi:hypothetical protein